jgi:hypothetical protein
MALIRNLEGRIAKIWVKISKKGKLTSERGNPVIDTDLSKEQAIAIVIYQCMAKEWDFSCSTKNLWLNVMGNCR